MTINNILNVQDLEENGLYYKGKLKKYVGRVNGGANALMKDVVGYKKVVSRWIVFITNEDGVVVVERLCESEAEAKKEILRIAKFEDFVNIKNRLENGMLV